MEIEFEVRINRTVTATIDFDEIASQLTGYSTKERLSFACFLISGLTEYNLKDLTEEQREMLKSWLENRLKDLEKFESQSKI